MQYPCMGCMGAWSQCHGAAAAAVGESPRRMSSWRSACAAWRWGRQTQRRWPASRRPVQPTPGRHACMRRRHASVPLPRLQVLTCTCTLPRVPDVDVEMVSPGMPRAHAEVRAPCNMRRGSCSAPHRARPAGPSPLEQRREIRGGAAAGAAARRRGCVCQRIQLQGAGGAAPALAGRPTPRPPLYNRQAGDRLTRPLQAPQVCSQRKRRRPEPGGDSEERGAVAVARGGGGGQ